MLHNRNEWPPPQYLLSAGCHARGPWLHTSIALHDAAAADHMILTQRLVRHNVSADGLIHFCVPYNCLLLVRYLQYIDTHLPRSEIAWCRTWHTLPQLTTTVRSVLLPAC